MGVRADGAVDNGRDFVVVAVKKYRTDKARHRKNFLFVVEYGFHHGGDVFFRETESFK